VDPYYGPGADTTFVYHDDFVPDVGTAATLRNFGGPLVSVGRAQDILFRRSDPPPFNGKVALLRREFGGDGAASPPTTKVAGEGLVEPAVLT
jgi:hypothetical protein